MKTIKIRKITTAKIMGFVVFLCFLQLNVSSVVLAGSPELPSFPSHTQVPIGFDLEITDVDLNSANQPAQIVATLYAKNLYTERVWLNSYMMQVSGMVNLKPENEWPPEQVSCEVINVDIDNYPGTIPDRPLIIEPAGKAALVNLHCQLPEGTDFSVSKLVNTYAKMEGYIVVGNYPEDYHMLELHSIRVSQMVALHRNSENAILRDIQNKLVEVKSALHIGFAGIQQSIADLTRMIREAMANIRGVLEKILNILVDRKPQITPVEIKPIAIKPVSSVAIARKV